ncbi:hypothetical protein J7M23_03635, partial [Candidatus Sumerlaeota bacterium]|nr:hypothetical protein [Candidatus Sumerlaeota bacterium]
MAIFIFIAYLLLKKLCSLPGVIYSSPTSFGTIQHSSYIALHLEGLLLLYGTETLIGFKGLRNFL